MESDNDTVSEATAIKMEADVDLSAGSPGIKDERQYLLNQPPSDQQPIGKGGNPHLSDLCGDDSTELSRQFICGSCGCVFDTVCNLHAHILNHNLGGSYHYNHNSRTAFPKYDSVCCESQTDINLAPRVIQTIKKCLLIGGNLPETSEQQGLKKRVRQNKNIMPRVVTTRMKSTAGDRNVLKRKYVSEESKSQNDRTSKSRVKKEKIVNSCLRADFATENSMSHENDESDSAEEYPASYENDNSNCAEGNTVSHEKDNSNCAEGNTVSHEKDNSNCAEGNSEEISAGYRNSQSDFAEKKSVSHENNKSVSSAGTSVKHENSGSEYDTSAESLDYASRFEAQQVCSEEKVLEKVALYQCEKCEKSFRTKLGYTRHFKAHQNSFTYYCDICGKGYNYRSDFFDHRATHSDDKNYECSKCKKRLKTRRSLKGHEDVCGQRKFIQCDICGTMFKSKKYLKDHLNLHEDQITLRPCNTCGLVFQHYSSLYRHRKKAGH